MAGACYVLEVSLGAPGPESAELYAYGALEHVRSCLEQLISPAGGAAPRYDVDDARRGVALILWALTPGREAEALELRPFVRVRVGGGDAVALDTPAFARLDDDLRAKRVVEGGATLEFDWAEIAARAPRLGGEPLRPGQALDLETIDLGEAGGESPLSTLEALPYGYSDHEGGLGPPPGFIDPDPPR